MRDQTNRHDAGMDPRRERATRGPLWITDRDRVTIRPSGSALAVAARAVMRADLEALTAHPGEPVTRPVAPPEWGEMAAAGRYVRQRDRHRWHVVATLTGRRYVREFWRGRRLVETAEAVPSRVLVGSS